MKNSNKSKKSKDKKNPVLIQIEFSDNNLSILQIDDREDFEKYLINCIDRYTKRKNDKIDNYEFEDNIKNECVVCKSKEISCIFNCGHSCTCFDCALKLNEKKMNCPLCRKKIIEINKK